MNKSIIVFVRKPELGKVKTRLAKEIGETAALSIYKQLLSITRNTVAPLDCDKFIFYTESLVLDDQWENEVYKKETQQGDTLGDRMEHAFSKLFQAGYAKVIIIGSDCPGLTTSAIEEAYQKLDTCEVVIGPAEDGGYYLLGLTKPFSQLFRSKAWSTGTVFSDTVKDLVHSGISYCLLPKLVDIDSRKDLDIFPGLLDK
ncbi:MAG: TIGR04282 family arsenosugar biosynthesis glycosyltransferase [Chitinophagaceae bacterium]|nr:TIGR04282 family arsenosugar biosynthesis glycosyltransferase [Chitinophagaceae bacterium]